MKNMQGEAKDKNVANWEEIYKNNKAGSFMNYPSENLVTLFFRNMKSINAAGKCLDYGFGSANNSEFLLQHMHDVYGIEISESSVNIARKRLSKFKNFYPENFVAREEGKDFNGFFDLIVAWQMLYYNDKTGLDASIDKLHGYLSAGGILICTLITNRDVKTKLSSQVEEDTYLIDGRFPHQEGCKVYSPKSEQDFLNLFGRFDIIDYGYFERSSFLSENTSSEYYLVAGKR